MQQQVTEAYEKQFGGAPQFVVRAPGRVNLIGEHTDYNDGFVMPMAIDRAIWIALAPRDDSRVAVYSVDYDETKSFSLDSLVKQNHSWIEYLKGVAWVLKEKGLTLGGWNGVVAGDVPLAAGLSSSAALEVATARAFTAPSGLQLSLKELALSCQRAENQWVGMNCGIMDQLISATGQQGHAMLIDCRTLELTPAPLPAGARVVILDTSTRRGLEGSAYNERREQCEKGAAFFGATHLRDVSLARFERRGGDLEETVRRRCRHVVSENERTERAAKVLQAGDAETFGRLMNESHYSLRDDFEVSCRELDIMAECARRHEACYGARMTGGGFGGCAVALVREEGVESFVETVRLEYEENTGLEPNIYVCAATDGASVITIDD